MNTTTQARNATLVALGCLALSSAPAQDRIAVPLTNPSRPVVLEVNTFGTAINVSAYDGKEVVVATRQGIANEGDDDRPGARPRPPRAPRGNVTTTKRRISPGCTAYRTARSASPSPRRTTW